MSRPRQIRVLIADDNKTYRRGMRLRLDHAEGITVIGEAGTGTDAVTIARAERPDVVLMDLHMPGRDGIEATRALSGAPRSPRILLITSEASDAFVLEALEAGAIGYLLKNHDTEHLVAAVRGAVEGAATVSPRMTPRLLRELAQRRRFPPDPQQIERLSRSERKVVALLSSGLTANDDIARELKLSASTVRTHTASAMKKLKLEDRTQLALWGIRHGLERFDAG